MTLDFSARSTTEELMDDAEVSDAELEACLADLERVNRLTLAYRPTLGFLDRVLAHGRLARGRRLHVLDVACGHGDMLREVARWARRRRVPIALTGLDLRLPDEVKRAACDPPIRWVDADVFTYEPAEHVDVVLSSQFTHHLPDDDVVRFLRWMEDRAGVGWLISDLHRHRLPYEVFRRAAAALRYHRFVQHDGPVSIARAFTREDWQRLIARAELPMSKVQVVWRVPFRWTVERLV